MKVSDLPHSVMQLISSSGKMNRYKEESEGELAY